MPGWLTTPRTASTLRLLRKEQLLGRIVCRGSQFAQPVTVGRVLKPGTSAPGFSGCSQNLGRREKPGRGRRLETRGVLRGNDADTGFGVFSCLRGKAILDLWLGYERLLSSMVYLAAPSQSAYDVVTVRPPGGER
jgi:hypothetical protein